MKRFKLNYLPVVTLVALGSLSYSCNSPSNSSGPSATEQRTRDSLRTDSITKSTPQTNGIESDKAALKVRIKELEDKIDKKMDELDSKIKTANVKTKKELEEQKRNYQAAKDKLDSDMGKFSTSLDKDWQQFKKATDARVDSMEKAFKLD